MSKCRKVKTLTLQELHNKVNKVKNYQGLKGFKRIWGASLEIVFRNII